MGLTGDVQIFFKSQLQRLLTLPSALQTPMPDLDTLKAHLHQRFNILQLIVGVGKDGNAAGIPNQLNDLVLLLEFPTGRYFIPMDTE